ncbi:glycine betaine ABC transporter substrate-binding protein [Salsuginibacillus kocurii]|uniref:glycine betaine ABC transporter substrate-binding protein n=1 Tax=Salsuginibacillus kocurii TaxID=427078 RepID=UPI0003752D45|nr:glycine betaine ABC transporter substrate-binding protein [Salsuginibacillus kocurii]
MNKKLLIGSSLFALSMLVACGEGSGDGESNSSIGEELDYTITGIDPGTGIMDMAAESIDVYDLGDEWEVQSSSDAVMTAELASAIENEEPIVVTGWQPHWKFTEHDVKFLEDPELVFGDENDVHTLVRNGLEEDLPGAYKLFDQFEWELEEQNEVMLMEEEEEMEPEEAARTWIEDNDELVAEWTEGVEEGEGETVELSLVEWVDAIATTNVMAEVLRDLNYEPELTPVQISAMYAGMEGGNVDAMFASWLPAQQTYYDDYEEHFEDLGPNSSGTRNGLVVPEYMDIDEIEDLAAE